MYKLSRFIDTNGRVITEDIASLSLAEYNNLIENEAVLSNFLSISNLYKITRLNAEDFLKYLDELKTYLNQNKVLILLDQDVKKININRLLLNFLFAFRTYIDHLETFLKREYGSESKEVKDFKSLTGSLYDDNFEYRFFYKLRNYAQHCGLPVDDFQISPSISTAKYSVKVFVRFDLEKLQLDFDWGSHVRIDLEKQGKFLDVQGSFENFLSLINQIDIWFSNNVFNVIEPIKQKLAEIDSTVLPTRNLCITFRDTDNKWCAVNSIFRYIAEIEKKQQLTLHNDNAYFLPRQRLLR